MVLESLTTPVGNALTNEVSYWLLVVIITFFVFLGMKFFDIPKMYAGITSLLLTVFLLEFVLKAVFGALNIPLNFGSYVVTIPFYTTITLTDGVMLMKFLDFVFNFGLVRLVGLPYLETFITTSQYVPDFVVPIGIFEFIASVVSSPFNIFVFLYTSIDSIIEYVFFYYLFFALIVLISDIVGENAEKWESLAYLLAFIPIMLYSFYVSNPIYEYGVAVPELQKVFYFMFHADAVSLTMFFGSLLLSFLLVMQILAAFVSVFYGVGESTFRPDWAMKQFEVNTQGVGFVYTLAFAVMYMMHQYSWYIFFPAMVLYSVFKKFTAGAMEVVKGHNEKQDMADYIGSIVQGGGSSSVKKGQTGGGDVVYWGIVILLLGVVVFVLFQLGWMPV